LGGEDGGLRTDGIEEKDEEEKTWFAKATPAIPTAPRLPIMTVSRRFRLAPIRFCRAIGPARTKREFNRGRSLRTVFS